MGYPVHSDENLAEIKASLGISSAEELFSHIPKGLHKATAANLERPLDEYELIERFHEIIAQGKSPLKDHCCGYGLYRHRIPLTVDHLGSRREFVTSYTPYQPEVAQGTLQALFEYQSLVSIMTGMPVANASLYDGSTALVEAVRMAIRQKGFDHARVYFSAGVNPRYEEVFQSYFFDGDGKRLVDTKRLQHDAKTGATIWPSDVADIIVVQNPHYLGIAEPTVDLRQAYPDAAIIYLTTEMLSTVILQSPSAWGADIVCGEAQSLGLPVNYSGPTLGFIAAKNDYLRNMPGRLVGKTTAQDADGNPTDAFVITLATREQHIRREKATSNICSNQTLMAVRAAIFMGHLGWSGMQQLMALSMEKAHEFASELRSKNGGALLFPDGQVFHEVAWKSDNIDRIIDRCVGQGFFPGVRIDANTMLSYFHDDFSPSMQRFLLNELI
jgi:glycine dehydrogenase subunit 1